MPQESPHDVNSSQMRAVYGNRIRLDDPILGDNPKVAALRAEHSDSNIKALIDEALKKFFFPDFDHEEDEEHEHEEPAAPETPIEPKAEPDADDKMPVLISLFKMLLDTVFSHKQVKGGNK